MDQQTACATLALLLFLALPASYLAAHTSDSTSTMRYAVQGSCAERVGERGITPSANRAGRAYTTAPTSPNAQYASAVARNAHSTGAIIWRTCVAGKKRQSFYRTCSFHRHAASMAVAEPSKSREEGSGTDAI